MIVEFMRYGDLANVLRTNSGVLSLQQTESPSLEMVSFTRNTRCILLFKQDISMSFRAFLFTNTCNILGRFVAH